MIESSFTLYKLIILYMLQNVNFPLSNTQISDFILEKEYTNYFHLQEALSELQDTKLIEIEKVRNTSYYHMTEEGSKTLSFFENEISPEIREEIDRYMKEHSYELRKKASVVADYHSPKIKAELSEKGFQLCALKPSYSLPAYWLSAALQIMSLKPVSSRMRR